MKVLLVDDEHLAVTRMRHLLQSFPDIEIVGTAYEAEEAFSKILKLKPDVVFIDVEIGNSTGYEVIDQVNKSGFRPKYIVVTAFSQYAITGIRSRVDDYLLKPVDLTDLKAALERVTGKKLIRYHAMETSIESRLTNRERVVLTGMIEGKTSKEIAAELFLSHHTIDTFRRKILKKTGARDTTELIVRLSKMID